jgi:hypothetical protein
MTIPSVRPVPLPELPVGAEAPLLKFRPDLMLSEEYTDNFNFTATNKIPNFRTSLAPGGVLFLNDPTIKGSATGSLPIAMQLVRRGPAVLLLSWPGHLASDSRFRFTAR